MIPLSVNFDGIPEPLKQSGKRWCVWKLETKNGKPTKIPYQDKSKKGSSIDTKTWLSFSEAVKNYESGDFSGIGIYLGGSIGDRFDDMAGLDWDHIKERDGEFDPDILDEIIRIGSYAEISPSGTGARCFCFTDIPEKLNKRNNREIYKSSRFLTVTGHHIPGTSSTIEEVDPDGFKVFYDRLVGESKPIQTTSPSKTQKTSTSPNLKDEQIIQKCRNAKNKEKFEDLYDRGLITNYGSQSEADFGLCGLLAFYTQDEDQIDRVFRSSALYRPKWDEIHGNASYGMTTIRNAIAGTTEHYDPKKEIKRRLDKIEKSKAKRKREVLGSVEPENSSETTLKLVDDRETQITEPLIQILSTESPEIQMEKALNALILRNEPPCLFVRSGEMVGIIKDEHGQPMIKPVGEIELRGRMYECLEFRRPTSEHKIRPPIDIIRDVLKNRKWVNRLPHISGISETPLIHENGEILRDPGYDVKTGLFYAPSPGLTIPNIPIEPSRHDINLAVKTIWEPFKDFRFVDIADGTHIVAALITTVCRNLIKGNVPLILIDKPQAGTGASLISDVVGIVSEGRKPGIMTMPESEAEWKKVILSLLIAGRTTQVIDNIEGVVKSPALAALLTTSEYSDRVLGTNDSLTLPHRITWIGNGNNIRIGGDLPRRCYWTRMDAQTERPWTEKREYVHSDLIQWVTDNRGDLLAAILTLVRGWILVGRPKPSDEIPIMGGFEDWRNVIGGILEFSGIKGFLGNTQRMYDLTDIETPQWSRFCYIWHTLLGENLVTTKQLFEKLHLGIQTETTFITLQDALPEQFLDVIDRPGSFVRMMGTALSKRCDRRYPSGFKIERGGELKHAMLWKVKKIETQKELL